MGHGDGTTAGGLGLLCQRPNGGQVYLDQSTQHMLHMVVVQLGAGTWVCCQLGGAAHGDRLCCTVGNVAVAATAVPAFA
jgi:hypothetical protein